MYYAISHTYGVATTSAGTRIGTLHRFSSRVERDTWVAETAGLPRSQPGYRESLDAVAARTEIRRSPRSYFGRAYWREVTQGDSARAYTLI